jgi:hypothetical protein
VEGVVESSIERPRGNPRAVASLVLGLLSVLAVPAGVMLSRETSVSLLQASGAIGVAAALGWVAIIEARRGRERVEMTLGRVGGGAFAAIGRLLGILGILAAASAGLALGFFGLLTLFAS